MGNSFCWTGLWLYNGNETRSHIQYKTFSTIFLIETQKNSRDLNLKTHPQSALAKGWTKGYKVQRKHSLVHFYTADTDTGVEYKVQDSSSRDHEAGLGKQALSIPARVPHLLAEHSFQSQIFEPHQKYLGFFSFIFSCSLFAARAITSFPPIIQRHTFHEYKKN